MKIAALFALFLVFAGCSARTNVNASSGGPGAVPGTAQVQVQSGSSFVTLFGLTVLGALAFEAHGWRSIPYPFSSVFDETPLPPELDPDRKISEQDCTRPVDYSRGNILCK